MKKRKRVNLITFVKCFRQLVDASKEIEVRILKSYDRISNGITVSVTMSKHSGKWRMVDLNLCEMGFELKTTFIVGFGKNQQRVYEGFWE